jgi:ABC-2 type transport system permease protein
VSVRAAAALLRASWRTARSYRLQLVLSVVSLFVTVLPVYFVAQALQPVMARSIADEGAQAFGFLLTGSIALSLIAAAMNTLATEISGGISSGFFEALLASPTPLGAIVVGQSAYASLWVAARAVLLLLLGWVLGAPVHWSAVPAAIVVLAALVAAYTGVGLASAALTLAYRTTARLPQAVLLGSLLLGGAYYSTDVLPEPLRPLSALVPLTYGLRATRRVLLQGASLGEVMGDLGALLMFAGVLFTAGGVAFVAALRYARRHGSLSHY